MILIVIMNKRVRFSEGEQKKLLKDIKKKTGLGWKEIARKLEVNEKTLVKSYMYEYCDLPYNLFKKICTILCEKENKILEKYGGMIKKEELVIGRKVFGEQKKVLDPIDITYTNKKLDLDVSKIGYSNYDLKKKIKIPTKITPELGEEIGMQFGDGFLSAKKYDYRLKGNPNNEKEYYFDVIKPLFKELYNLDVNLKEFKRSFGFEIYSKALWEFKVKVLGITPGKKYGIRFPEILKLNDKEILGAFLRGLFDTDGCVSFKSRYGYKNYYPTIEISLTSKNLIKDVAEILFMFGFNPGVFFNERYGRIAIRGIEALRRYEEFIGWSSPKNLNKVNEWKIRYPELNKRGDCSSMVKAPGCGRVCLQNKKRSRQNPGDGGPIPPFRLYNQKR